MFCNLSIISSHFFQTVTIRSLIQNSSLHKMLKPLPTSISSREETLLSQDEIEKYVIRSSVAASESPKSRPAKLNFSRGRRQKNRRPLQLRIFRVSRRHRIIRPLIRRWSIAVRRIVWSSRFVRIMLRTIHFWLWRNEHLKLLKCTKLRPHPLYPLFFYCDGTMLLAVGQIQAYYRP